MGEGRPRRSDEWGETIVATSACALVLFLIARPAFRAFFFGEAFLYLGQYWAQQGHFWRALWSPSGLFFFKPVCFSMSVPWYFLLPLEPWPYHARNFVFSVVNLVLLHRVLLRLVASRWARALALVAFAVSKVHLTTIGYLMIFDSIVMLMFLLITVLFTLRWCDHPSNRDRRVALLACCLTAFTKDYGIVVVPVVLTVLAAYAPRARGSTRAVVAPFWPWIVSFGLLLTAKVACRWTIVGALPWNQPVYAPRLSLMELFRKTVLLVSTITNVAVSWHDKLGATGIGRLVAHAASLTGHELPRVGSRESAEWIDGLVALAIVALAAITWVRTRPRRSTLWVPLVWIGAFFVPPLLIGNLQIYYTYESIAGAAVLLGVVLATASSRLLVYWTIALAVIGIGGAISNHRALYDWQYAADSAGRIEQAVVARYRNAPLTSVTFVTRDPVFWRWVLTADDQAPMLQALMRRPDLLVRVQGRSDIGRPIRAGLVLDADAGFSPVPSPDTVPDRSE